MFLAVREIRRAPVRFAFLAVAVGLLLFLVLFQQGLQRGLISAFVGAIRNQNAPVVVYSVDGQRTLQGSVVLDPGAVLAVDGVGHAARVSQGTFTGSVNGGAADDVTLLGTDRSDLGWPTRLAEGRLPTAPGEAVGSAADVRVGDRVELLGPNPTTLTVVGTADDVQLNVNTTLFVARATYEAAAKAVNPGARSVPVNALLIRPADGVTDEEVAARINAAVADADAVTRATAAATTPGVDQVQQSFAVIFALYGLVVPLVIGLFFLIVTLQKRRSLTLLRAMGAKTSVLARSLVLQVVMVTMAGLVIGWGLFTPLSGRTVGGLTLRLDSRTVLTWCAVFLTLAVLGSLGSLRRLLRVDPVTAATGGDDR